MKSFLSVLLVLMCPVALMGCDALNAASSPAKRPVEISGPSIDEVGSKETSSGAGAMSQPSGSQVDAPSAQLDTAGKDLPPTPGSDAKKAQGKPSQPDADTLFRSDSQSSGQSEAPTFK